MRDWCTLYCIIPLTLVTSMLSTFCQGQGFQSEEFNRSKTIKIYVYDLPASLNEDILHEAIKRFETERFADFSYEGMGEEVADAPKIPGISIRNTNQFSLEVIMHHKLLKSKYRTIDPTEADIFYVPAYAGLKCMMNTDWYTDNLKPFLSELEQFLRNQTHFRHGKPHFSSIAKIQREMSGMGIGCHYLTHPVTKHLTFLAIEKETEDEFKEYIQDTSQSVIVVPYPSYLHYTDKDSNKEIDSFNYNIVSCEDRDFRIKNSLLSERLNFCNLNRVQTTNNIAFKDPERPVLNVANASFSAKNEEITNFGDGIEFSEIPDNRDILALYPVGISNHPHIRSVLQNQFLHKTHLSYDEYVTKNKFDNTSKLIQIATYDSGVDTINTTISWMKHSVFCLQPPGDSPTRKSFYDSLLCGCIPVMFVQREIPYAFSSILDYSEFSIIINIPEFINNKQKIEDILDSVRMSTIRKMQRRLAEVSRFMQYSVHNNEDCDSIELILYELAHKFKL